jgi:hypothetical protein
MRRNFFPCFAGNGSPRMTTSGVEMLKIAFSNCMLDSATFNPEMKKTFDVLAEGLRSEKSRDNRTAIELFLIGIRGWEAGLRRFLD